MFTSTIHCQTVIITPISGTIPSAKGLVEGLKKTPADIAFLVPSIVQELSQSPELLDYCTKNLKMIFFCGGDLPASIGDVVSSKIRLVNQFGATEIGLMAQIQPEGHKDPKDWKYIQLHPETGAQLRHYADAAYELYIVRDQSLEMHQPTFTFFPDLQEYSSRDLFVRHSSKDKADFWKWHARADDIIVFLNGEKTNPIQMEQLIVSSNPEVTAALVAGAQRFQAALLVERVVGDDGKEPSPSERAAFIENIWATIEEANEVYPSHARISKSQILFTKPEKPMVRAGKGTIQRAATLQLYAQELDALYADADILSAGLDGETSIRLEILEDVYATSHFIRETVSLVTNWLDLDDADNFFTLGMDSLQALRVLRNLKKGLGLSTIALSTIYTNPSISALASAIIRLSTQHQERQISGEQALSQERSVLFREYQDLIDRIPIESNVAKEAHDHNVVILTGSTGSLGSYLLKSLLSNPTVAHVYCLDRAPNGTLRIERTKARGLSSEVSSSRVTFLTADLPQTYLGLEPEVYRKLINTVTLVIHNAWPVNFNLSLLSFRPQLSGLVNLIEFTALAPTAPHLFFISSISTIFSYQSPSLLTPEQVLPLDSAPSPGGYAASKFLSEHLLDYAAQRLSIKASLARIGQIAGAVYSPGLWNKAEWFPSLVISSLHVGALPDSLGPRFSKIDWIPIDLLADILVELALAKHQQQPRQLDVGDDVPTSQAQVLHIINPNSTTWETVRPIVADTLSAFFPQTEKAALDIIPPSVWLEKIHKAMESTSGSKRNDGALEAALQLNPAVKLLAFYQDILSSSTNKVGGVSPPGNNELEIRETVGKSMKLSALEAIKTEWLQKWIGEWFDQS